MCNKSYAIFSTKYSRYEITNENFIMTHFVSNCAILLLFLSSKTDDRVHVHLDAVIGFCEGPYFDVFWITYNATLVTIKLVWLAFTRHSFPEKVVRIPDLHRLIESPHL